MFATVDGGNKGRWKKVFETQLSGNTPKLPKAKASTSISKILCGKCKVARQASHSDVS